MTNKRRRDLKLGECWLYATASPADLARRLAMKDHPIQVEYLEKLAKDAGNFRLFSIKGANGKSREVQWPKPRLQWIHSRIHSLLSRVQVPDYLHSAVRGRSYISNAGAHNPAAPAIKIDVKKFFPSVSRAAIFNFFAGPMECRRDVAGLLADILTFDAHLPTGSSAGPIIAFYAFKPMFDEIARLATKHELTMSCYVDDMTLSGARATKGVLFEIHKIIARHGLKSHKAHVFAALEPKVVTGVCNTPAGPRVPNKLHLKIKQGFEELSATPNSKARKKVLDPLLGRLEAAGQIDPRFRARALTVRSLFQK
jgi:hypothetical protein